MKNFLQVNRALAAEKNIYLNLNQLPSKNDGGQSCDGNRQSRVMSQSGCSAVDVPMTSYGAPDEHPMSTRSASDGTRWNSRVWKYVAMIFAVLVMSVANIGMAWAWNKVYFIGDPTGNWTSNKTSHVISNNADEGSAYFYFAKNNCFAVYITYYNEQAGPADDKSEMNVAASGAQKFYIWEDGENNHAAKYVGNSGIVEVHAKQKDNGDDQPWVWLTRPTVYINHKWNNTGSASTVAMTDNNDGTYTYTGYYSSSSATIMAGPANASSHSNIFKEFGSSNYTKVGSPTDKDKCIFEWNPSGYRSTTSYSSNRGTLTVTRLYSITYNGNGKTGGDVPSGATDVKWDATTTVAGNTGSLVRTGYAFIGWNTAADGTGKFYLPGSTFTPTATSHTLYAQWLQLHEPGVYESSGGYNKSLKTYSGREYEIYRYAINSSTVSIFAGESKTTSSEDKHCVAQFATDASSNAKFGGWIMHNGGISNNTSYASNTNAEFSAVSSSIGIKGWGGQGYFIYVSGYDQFDLWAQDKNTSNNIVKVYRNGVDVTTGTASSLTVRNYTLDPNSSYLIQVECLGDKDGNGTWLGGFSLRLPPSSCTAPTGLSAGSTSAKGTTFTVTDGANTNNYEIVCKTTSGTPAADATPTYTSTSKTKAVTDLVAGTKYYAWVRSKCSASNKSDWVSGGNFTTSKVTMTPTLTNVTHTSGATSSIGGSDYTAVFTANTGYSMPNPTVTIGGNAATSGTHYTWSVDGSVGTITIPANKINGNIAITLNSVPSAPSSATISGAYHYFPGENISLTCTPSGNNGPTTYQWYKGGKADGNRIDGATSATYTKNSCAFEDAGSYYCKVTCNATSIWAVTNSHENYDVKILRLYVNGSKSGDPYGNVDFEKVDGTTATASIALGSGWTY